MNLSPQAEHALSTFKSFLSRLTVGSAMHHGNLTLFPLFGKNGHEPAYTLLQTAIAAGEAEVTEVNESGSVPNLRIHNRGRIPILIPEGEILVGAKQNRVVNLTILVPAETTFTLPVSCVEQGRWGYTSKHFRVAYSSPPTLRAKKIRSVQRHREATGSTASDQGEVWETVGTYLRDAGATSTTSSLTDGFLAVEEQIAEYRKKIVVPETACGVLIARHGTIVGMDLFDSPKTLAGLSKRLLDAYFLEAACDPKASEPTSEADAKAFLSRVAETAKPYDQQLGLGVELEIRSPELAGTALCYSDSICHLSAFAAK